MTLAIEDIRLGHLVVAFRHQGHFHLVLDFLHRDTIINLQAAHHINQHLLGGKAVHREEGLGNGVFDLVCGERLPLAVTLNNVQLVHHHVDNKNFKTAQGEMA